MSKYIAVSVRDSAVGLFAVPQFVVSKGIAMRSFADEVRRVDPANQLNKHPEDFTLYVLGTYDDESGMLDWHLPELLVKAIDFKE